MRNILPASLTERVTNVLQFWPQARRLVVKGGWALLDQGLFSGANFLVNILLARWLTPGEYGAFAVALSVFYLLAGFHTAILTEPMMVFGAGKYRERFREFLQILLWAHALISLLIVLILGATSLVMARLVTVNLAYALAGLTIASPFLLFLWLARRAPYVKICPHWAVIGGMINFFLISIGLYGIKHFGLLSSFWAFMILGGSAIITSIAILSSLFKHPFHQNQDPRYIKLEKKITWLEVVVAHWKYGKWNLVATLSYLLSGQMVLLFVPIFLGLEKSALLAAILNIYRPIVLMSQAMYPLLLPSFSRALNRRHVQISQSTQLASMISIIFGTMFFFYGLIITLSSDKIFLTLYNGKYLPHKYIIGIIGIMYIFSAIAGVWFVFLKACQKIKVIALIQSVSAGLIVVVSVPAMYLANLFGAVASMAFSYGLTLILILLTVKKFFSIGGIH